MSDGYVGVKQATDPDRLIDNEVISRDGQDYYRQRVTVPGGVDVADSAEREYTHVTATVVSSGDTTVHTPAAGKAIRLRWVYAVNNPTATSAPLIKVKLGAEEKFCVFALSKRQLVTGAADAPLVVNLSEAGMVAFTAILEEITP